MNASKVIWQEGMLLRPQHLQQNDRYHEQQLRTHTQILGGYFWGFLTLEIDLQLLSTGKVVVTQAHGILPDASLFELGDSQQPRVLQIPPNLGKTPIYLALPLVAGNCIEARRAEQTDVIARYIIGDTQVADSNADQDSRCQIVCARPDFRLLLGDQPADQGYVKLKIAEVLESTGDGAVSLNPDYVPSFIHLKGSGYLLSCLKEVLSLLVHRGDSIAERLRTHGQGGGTEVGDFMMLQLINRTEVLLRHYLHLPQVRPEELYRTLLSMLGDFVTFASGSKRPRLDGHYQHHDQAASFRTLMNGIREVLSMVLEQHAIELELQVRQYGILVSPLPDDSLLGSATFVLAASAGCGAEELRHRLPGHLKVGPVERIRQLVNLHLTGIKVRPLSVAPRQIPFHASKTYFVLELTPEDVSQLERSGGLAFHASGELSDLELQFWAIRK